MSTVKVRKNIKKVVQKVKYGSHRKSLPVLYPKEGDLVRLPKGTTVDIWRTLKVPHSVSMRTRSTLVIRKNLPASVNLYTLPQGTIEFDEPSVAITQMQLWCLDETVSGTRPDPALCPTQIANFMDFSVGDFDPCSKLPNCAAVLPHGIRVRLVRPQYSSGDYKAHGLTWVNDESFSPRLTYRTGGQFQMEFDQDTPYPPTTEGLLAYNVDKFYSAGSQNKYTDWVQNEAQFDIPDNLIVPLDLKPRGQFSVPFAPDRKQYDYVPFFGTWISKDQWNSRSSYVAMSTGVLPPQYYDTVTGVDRRQYGSWLLAIEIYLDCDLVY